ncbi:DUF3048 domain-containing protein [Clostridium sp. D2Q-14]|uniref:DUF3048 domain-containing protein n=1 Tax=Anaeromonas gelatinilytica TaxID=2683194 RepID=UPI00193B2B37|nr:DUF3048 domain-containing protein [Anaeromonas gelatinilytica]
MKKIFLILVIIFLIFTISCSEDQNNYELDDTDNQSEEENESINDKSEKVVSPLSGIYTEKNKVDRRPVAVMFDNHRNARWQSGLSEAEVLYEFLVEGKITRYMAIYLVNDPEVIGPVRSSRPYFLSAALEYDSLYVHCGGSPEAVEDIEKLNIDNVSCMSESNDVFYRNNEVGKSSPHNLYTNMESIRKYQDEIGYNLDGDYEAFSFNKEIKSIKGDNAKEVIIDYGLNNITSYKYDDESNLYLRYKDGKPHIDENNNTNLTATNIIIQEANTQVIDEQKRLQIDIIGKGEGYYITNGEYIKITWEKDSRESKTRYYDELGKEIILNPGNTWIQVTPINPEIKIS